MASTKSTIWTPANIVTMVRVVFVPVWLLCAELAEGVVSYPQQGYIDGARLFVALFYVILALTDKLDGHLARSRNEVSTFGKFLDPIADKLVVVVSLCFLLEVGSTSSWVLLIIVAREFLVSGLRMVVATQGVVVAASNLGKWKTATTMVSISGLFFARALGTQAAAFASALGLASQAILVIAVILTAWSGLDYFVKSRAYVLGSE